MRSAFCVISALVLLGCSPDFSKPSDGSGSRPQSLRLPARHEDGATEGGPAARSSFFDECMAARAWNVKASGPIDVMKRLASDGEKP